MRAILKIRDLTITNGSSPILSRIDLDVAPGEIVGIIGESGAGKSTLGLAAMGYSRDGCNIAAGHIEFMGVDLLHCKESRLRTFRGHNIAYVAQSAAASFNPAHRLVRQVSEPMVRHGLMDWKTAKRQTVDLFEQMGLPGSPEFADRFPHQVSGGQLQRAMTSMAMGCSPDLVIFDEPTTALDVTTQIEVVKAILRMIRKSNTSALYISHDLALVAQLADRLVVLRNGCLVEEGTTSRIICSPTAPYTQRLVTVRASDTEIAFRQPRPEKASPLLKVSSLSASYGCIVVLDDVSVHVEKGQTVAIVGESGSGKSTLARAVSGLLKPSEGNIRFGNDPLPPALANRTSDQLRHIQMIYQNPDQALNPRHRVCELLARPLVKFQNIPATAVEAETTRLLEAVRLPRGFHAKLPAQLSGGEKQRVAIARALAAKPDLLICDEVTSALDPLVADEILTLLQQLQDESGVALLFITHDLGTVRRIAHRVVVMRRGRIIQQGTTEDVFENPNDDYTKRLISSIPEMRVGWLQKLDRQGVKSINK